MKKKFIIILLFIGIITAPFSCITVTANLNEDIFINELSLYRYDMLSGKTSKYTPKSSVKDSKSYIYTTSDGKYTKSYIPEGLSADMPDDSDERHLLGSWSKINPATAGQYRNTVYITYKKGNSSYRATGFMIGPSAVATNGHVVYSGGKFADYIVVTPAYANGSKPYGSANGIGIVYNEEWADTYSAEYDWAVIELDANIGDRVGWLGLKYQSSSYNGNSIKINGYPGYVNGVKNYYMYRSDGTISKSSARLLYSTNTNTIDGMSGGPLYFYSSDTGYTAIGFVQGGNANGSTNTFVRITKEVFDLFASYITVRV